MIVTRICLAASLVGWMATSVNGAERSPPEAAAHCAGYGPGFQAVPGTRSCVRAGGRVVSEAQAESSRRKPLERGRFNNEGQVYLDARTDTEQGPVRTFIQMRAGRTSGP